MRFPNQIFRQFTSLLSWRRQKNLSSLLLILLLGISSVPAFSKPQMANIPSATRGLKLPHERNWHSLNQIYEFDRAPLGQRIPIILVPGRAEEFQQDSWWKRFNHDSHRNAFFRHNFKLYVFLYNSGNELDVQANSLNKDLQLRFGHLSKDQPLMLVTYSLGGVITREVLKDPEMLNRVDTMMAISVPFHGSPIFDPDWFTDFLNPPNRSPVRRFWDRSIYRSYMFRKSNLTRGMGWDNFDSSRPQFQVTPGNNSNIKPISVIKGDQAHSLIPPFVDYPMEDEIRAKTMVYASYLENGYTHSNQPLNSRKLPNYVLDNFPKDVLGSILPVYGFTVHSVFTYMNYQLSNLATYTPEDPQGRNTHLYRFNDGAIPLSSMLFLKASDTPYSNDFNDLVKQASVRKVRIFVNLDHIDVGEYNLRKHRLVKPDLLHQDEGERAPNQWIIHDLTERLREFRGSNNSNL